MPANGKQLAVVGAIMLVLALVAVVRLSGRADEDAGVTLDGTVVDPPPKPIPQKRATPRSEVHSPSTVTRPQRHGRQLPAMAPEGYVRLRVLDEQTGARVPGFRVRVYGPGTAMLERRIEGFRTDVPLRLGMPANLEIQAEGYQRKDVRQVLLTEQVRSRQIEVRIKRKG